MYHISRLVLLAFFMTSAVIPSQTQAASSDDIMQCMADCIIEEGKSETATCKQRCANIKIDMNQYQPKDCMATYKQCKRDCDNGDKNCKKVCKRSLQGCV
jgi:hypothetical protein